MEHAIGLFTTVLALRLDLSGQSTFRALLQRVRALFRDTHEHQEFYWSQAVTEDRRWAALCGSSMCNFHRATSPLSSPLWSVPRPTQDSPDTIRNLYLGVRQPRPGNPLQYMWQYNADFFGSASAIQLATRYEELLACIAYKPEMSIPE